MNEAKPHHLRVVATGAVLEDLDGPMPPDCCLIGACDGPTCSKLPDGATCRACVWYRICADRGETHPDARECQHFPRMFVRDLTPKPVPKARAR